MTHASSDNTGSSADPDAPSTLDLGRHFRDLRGVTLPALSVAVVVAAIVFGVRASAPAQWSATVSANAQTSTTTAAATSTDSTSAALLTAPYVALGTDTGVLHDIVAAAGVPWSDAKARSRITVTDGQTPGLLVVQVVGDSAGQAAAVARQAVVTLDSDGRARALQVIAAQSTQMQADAAALNDQVQSLSVRDPKRALLQTQYQTELDQISQVRGSAARLVALSDPLASGSPVSPQPLRDAALALLVVLIVTAELLVALRGRWGSAVSPAWARRSARKHRAEFVDCTDGPTGPGNVRVETVVLSRLRSGADALLLRSSVTPDASSSVLAHAAQTESAGGGQLVELSANNFWWRSSALERATLAVVVARRGADDRGAIEDQLAALALADVPALLMLIEKAPRADVKRGTEQESRETPAEPDSPTPRPPARNVSRD